MQSDTHEATSGTGWRQGLGGDKGSEHQCLEGPAENNRGI